MKNKKSSKKTKVQLTINGIQTLPSGSFRVRRQINGKTYDATFKSRRDAVAYRNTLNG